jgi:cytochrome c553
MSGNEERSSRCRHSVPWLLATLVISLCWAGRSVASAAAEGGGDEGEDRIEAKGDSGAIEFFEKNVRPILAARCQGCHGPAKQKGGLRLDARATILAGGSTGPAVVPGKPKESLLVDAINYGETHQMPPKSKLPPDEIATLIEWVRRGVPWGLDTRPVIKTTTAKDAKIPDHISSEEFHARAQFWSFQPMRLVAPPAVKAERRGWARNPIDGFIQAALEKHGLAPAPEADKRTLIRRLSFDLIGLPPTPQEVAAFLEDPARDAYEKLVDRLLASPRLGERWARHWLDLVRYAETAGHEFDYDIPSAFRYRDYAIRAFNADLPYNQFVTEHIAGDLLESPRRHPVDGHNESILGCGFYFLGEGTHSPVDVREEQMRRIDNQIDVLSKTFLGLTVACARCHDHKFDPITSRDYYALAGFLCSSRHQQAFIDAPERFGVTVRRLRGLKEKIAAILGDARDSLPEPLQDQAALLTAARRDQARPVAAVSLPTRPTGTGGRERVFEDFSGESFEGWFVTGDAFGAGPSRAGDFRLEGAGRLVSIKPGQAHSGLIADRLQGVLRSRAFTIETPFLHYLAAGRGGRISVIIDGFEKIRSPIYGGLTIVLNDGAPPRWVTQDVKMWLGHSAYLELADGATVDFGGATAQVDDGHGWIAVDEIRMSSQPAPTESALPSEVTAAPAVALDLSAVIAALRDTSTPGAGRSENTSIAGRARLADGLAAAIDELRAIEAKIPEPSLALAIADGTGGNERIHTRGSHKNLGEVVPRRFLEVLGGSESSAQDEGSGRDELARRMVDPQANPLLPRVLVNRIWKHHFGEGIVRSTDDFGAMGQRPSHPELLDWLAGQLVARGWSIKAMHRLMVTSSTYRMTSLPVEAAERLDPTNRLLHRANVRRLEAEAIRDALLAVSGRLEQAFYGPSVPVHLTSFMEGRGRPGHSGPRDGDGRRSLYLNVRRNFLDPMFVAFDAPVPFSTMGRRNVSNVPAQALNLMNDPLVKGQARLWALRALAVPARSARERLKRLYVAAFGRVPTDMEVRASLAFLGATPGGRGNGPDEKQEPSLEAWADLCHVLINTKEFIFVD